MSTVNTEIKASEVTPAVDLAVKPEVMPAVKNLFSAINGNIVWVKDKVVSASCYLFGVVSDVSSKVWSAVRDFFSARWESFKALTSKCLNKISEKVGSRFYAPKLQEMQKALEANTNGTEQGNSSSAVFKRKASQSSSGDDVHFEQVPVPNPDEKEKKNSWSIF